jgi:hypothetical protein
MDKIVDAINDLIGGDDEQPDTKDQKRSTGDPRTEPDNRASSQDQHGGAKGHNLDQLVSDAKRQLGDKPQ